MADILLIDDDPSIHQIVSLFLEDVGHHVHAAITGLAGLKLAEQTRPDLILLDIAMPGMDGMAILRALRTTARTADIPVMIFTVHDREDFDLALRGQENVGYLKKPVNMRALQASVNQALPLARQRPQTPST
jgi:two-component system response regulator GlrR